MPELGTFLDIRHPNLKLAFCCLLAASLLPACGGGSSSSSAGTGTDSRTYQQGYAQGTVDTVDTMLDDLRRLQASLAGTGAPAQTSRGTLGRSFNLLEPRQRGTLATALATYIAQVEAARDAAAAATAGTAEAEAAQAAANAALQALQLVVAADTAARVSGLSNSQAAQDAAVRALTRIGEVDPEASDAQEQINTALSEALTEAQTAVDQLAAELARTQAQLGQQEGSSTGVIDRLRQDLSAARAALAAAERVLGRGDVNPSRARSESVSVEYFARTDNAGMALAAEDLPLQIPTDGVAYAAGKTVLTERTDATDEYPIRGTMYRDQLRAATATNSAVVSLYGSNRSSKYRLIRQGAADTRALRPPNQPGFQNFHARARTSIRFDAGGNPVVSFGSEPGDGLIYGDLEREQAIGCPASNFACNDATTADIRITFGARTDGGDPTGEPTRYWRKTVPWPRQDQDPNTPGIQDHPYYNDDKGTPCTPGDADCVSAEHDGGKRAPHAEPEQDGVYELLLSSYAPDLQGTAATDDDSARFLSYAAYGLWRHAGATWRNVWGPDGAPFTYSPGARIQTLHFGLDAFGDHNPLPTGTSGAFKGTFEGATMGWIVHAYPSGERTERNIDGYTRLRGTVELTAHIGEIEGKTNKVSGTMRNFEYWDGAVWNSGAGTSTALGGWQPRRSFNDLVVTLGEGGIDAQGAFTGATSTTSTTTAGSDSIEHEKFWGEGAYEGAFYGPAGGLEAAGTWLLPADDKGGVPGTPEHFDAIAGLVGSFGAACEGACAPAP